MLRNNMNRQLAPVFISAVAFATSAIANKLPSIHRSPFDSLGQQVARIVADWGQPVIFLCLMLTVVLWLFEDVTDWRYWHYAAAALTVITTVVHVGCRVALWA
jgi:hypothetical protein